VHAWRCTQAVFLLFYHSIEAWKDFLDELDFKLTERPLTKPTRVDFSKQNMRDECVAELPKILLRHKVYARQLFFFSCHITDTGAIAMAKFLRDTTDLPAELHLRQL